MDLSQFRTPRQRAEHVASYSQDKPLGHGENAQAILRGAKQWLPDIPGTIGDLVDMAYAGGRNVLQGQKQRTISPLGAGAAARRLVSRAEPRAQTELTDPDASLLEEAVRFLNPGMLNPKQALRLGALGMASGAPGALTSIIKPRGGNWFQGPGGELDNALEYLARRRDEPLAKWIQGPLRKYIQRDLATEADPIRRLLDEDRPVSHMPLEDLLNNSEGWTADSALAARAAENMPRTGIGKSGYAQSWETIADAFVAPSYNSPQEIYSYYKANAPEHPMAADWVRDFPKDQKIYDFAGDEAADFLGLPHLTDELHNALRPDSDLPQHLRISPEQLQQMGIEKAVRHVAGINDYRAALKAEANKEMLQGPGIIPVREYTENNPKGLRWVEIGRGLPKATSIQGSKDEEAALTSALSKQLKYEGDTMGHCVGGYCDEVMSGNSRIFSLRDAKGEPHVTIETAPFLRQGSGEDGAVLIQAKGKQNRVPKSEYMPFVKDFIQNSPISKWYGFEEKPEYMGLSPDELNKLTGYAQGGLVGKQDFDGITGYIME